MDLLFRGYPPRPPLRPITHGQRLNGYGVLQHKSPRTPPSPLPPPPFRLCLQISALARASQMVASSPQAEESLLYLRAATKAAEFLRSNLYRFEDGSGGTGTLLRSWRNGRASPVRQQWSRYLIKVRWSIMFYDSYSATPCICRDNYGTGYRVQGTIGQGGPCERVF